MYLKLAIRNAKRSIFDYLLYIFSMVVLVSVIYISNCLANWGDWQVGFQTMSLPLLIVVVMVVLVNYINAFIVKQRAKEFATYLLLGMEKNKLSRMFVCELFVIGGICFLMGVLLGSATYTASYYLIFGGAGKESIFKIVMMSMVQTLGYFCFVEVLSVVCMRQKIKKLQIVQIINEKRRNQPLKADRLAFWGKIFIFSMICYCILLSAIAFMPNQVMTAAISVIAIPMLLSVFSFYKWIYAFLASLRLSQREKIYQGNRLYQIAQMTSGSKTSASLNTVFGSCLIFSAVSFVCGTFLLHSELSFFDHKEQQWMGFLQIGVCIIFLVLYFSILSLIQMIDLKKEARNMKFLFYMGKNRSEIKSLLRTQVLIKLLLPTLMSFIVLFLAAPLINSKVNSWLPVTMHHFLLNALCGFMICFIALYSCCFILIYIVSLRYIE